MNIQHNPILDVQKAAQLYSEKDGVDIKYICTSSITTYGTSAADIFFRETPNPVFGNRYFGLYFNHNKQLMITNADKIEDLTFNMVDVDGTLHYSQHRHDYRTIADVSIDGGREYLRRMGNLSRSVKTLKLKDGEFVDEESNDDKFKAIEDSIEMIDNLKKYGTINKPKEVDDAN